jgi:clan AA aspartic protease
MTSVAEGKALTLRAFHKLPLLYGGEVMETATMGKVLVAAKIENLEDLFRVQQGNLPADQVRTVQVADALVDTGASTLMVPQRLIAQLGLQPAHTRTARTAGGTASLQVYRAARLTIQGRDCVCDVVAIADDLAVLIGQVPLELMDWVIDPTRQRLVGNPEHGGEQMIDVF